MRHPGISNCGAAIATPGLKGQAKKTVLPRAYFPAGSLKEGLLNRSVAGDGHSHFRNMKTHRKQRGWGR